MSLRGVPGGNLFSALRPPARTLADKPHWSRYTPSDTLTRRRRWLVDVVINTPPRDTSARTRSWVASAGEATLLEEVFDAETHQILARVADRQSAQRAGGGLMRSVPTDNQAAVRRMFRHWAMRLRHGLDEVRAQGTFEIL